jgi:hypothetical protein
LQIVKHDLAGPAGPFGSSSRNLVEIGFNVVLEDFAGMGVEWETYSK